MIIDILLHSTKIVTLAVSATVAVVTAIGGAGAVAEMPYLPHVELERGQDLDALIGMLASTDAHERAMAACEIGRLRDIDLSTARDALVGLLGDDSAVESRLCREHENWSDDRQSSPGREAAIALEDVGETAIEPLIGVLANGGPVEREHAALALGLIEHERAIGPLALALGDEAVAVRARAAWALGMIEDSAGVDGLVVSLRDDEADVREQAAWGLGMIEDGRAVEALLDAVEDEDAGVRKQALWALIRCVDDLDDADLDYEELAAKLRRALKGGASG